jgi:hypothetical protein
VKRAFSARLSFSSLATHLTPPSSIYLFPHYWNTLRGLRTFFQHTFQVLNLIIFVVLNLQILVLPPNVGSNWDEFQFLKIRGGTKKYQLHQVER